jgi:hypothetical protein
VGCGHPGCYPIYETPKCVKNCVNDELWLDSKHHGISAYEISEDPKDLMAEVYKNGPVEVAFDVYEVCSLQTTTMILQATPLYLCCVTSGFHLVHKCILFKVMSSQ